eukprot:662014-Amphidinium_carterae.1
MSRDRSTRRRAASAEPRQDRRRGGVRLREAKESRRVGLNSTEDRMVPKEEAAQLWGHIL